MGIRGATGSSFRAIKAERTELRDGFVRDLVSEEHCEIPFIINNNTLHTAFAHSRSSSRIFAKLTVYIILQ